MTTLCFAFMRTTYQGDQPCLESCDGFQHAIVLVAHTFVQVVQIFSSTEETVLV